MQWISNSSNAALPHAQLYGGPDCSLCERAGSILHCLAEEGLLTWERVDITSDPALIERYATRIPVVRLSIGRTFEGRISEYRLRKALAQASAHGEQPGGTGGHSRTI